MRFAHDYKKSHDGGEVAAPCARQTSTKKISRWWQRADLNRRPKAYESSALPLSYSAIVSVPKQLTPLRGAEIVRKHRLCPIKNTRLHFCESVRT